MQLLSIEGNTIRLDGGAMFGNVPKELWNKWEPADERNRIKLATRSLLVKTQDRTVLFEAGIGTFFEPKLKDRYGVEGGVHQLQESLNAVGISEQDIDAVVLSHLHFDHAGGLLPTYDDDELRLGFPNAKYYVSKEHWEYAQNPPEREKTSFIPLLQELLEKSQKLVLVDGPKHPDLDFTTFEFSNGHTKGMMLSWIDTGQGKILFATDLIPGKSWVHVPVSMGYDRFAEQKVEEKKDILAKLVDEPGNRIFFTHDLDTPCGVIKRTTEGKYVCEPASLS